MTVSNTDLFMAILSMDSYNRGYDPGIALSGNTGGGATITTDSAVLTVNGQRIDISAGFYAAAYETQYGTAISYRGTDFDGGPATNDVVSGWTFAVGDFTAVTGSRQSNLPKNGIWLQ
jgi:hypothetical protein